MIAHVAPYLVHFVLDMIQALPYIVGMADQDVPQQYYSYVELAHLCRRAPETIRYLVALHNIPHFRQYGTRRAERIALVPAEAVPLLQRLTVARQSGKRGN